MMFRHLLLGDRRIARGASYLDLISSRAVSSAATAEITGMTSHYDLYVIEITDLQPASDDVDLLVRTGLAGTYASGANDYRYSLLVREGNAVGVLDQTAGANDSKIEITSPTAGSGWSNGANTNGFVTLKIASPSNTSRYKVIEVSAVWSGVSNISVYCAGVGQRLATGAVDGIQISFSAGNIANAKTRLYGFGL